SEERITQLENNLIALQATHNNTLNQLTEAEPVFAEIPVQSDDEDTATVVEVDGNSLIDEDDEAENDFSELLELIATFQTDGVSDDDEETVFLNDIPETYIVQRGDSLLGISQRFFNTTDMVGEIMRLNNIENPDRIYFGKVLVLPRG
ncbi:MAG: LysM peptidoglycan-binding domain-containing protein, partial [Defluviitaleaceae bacterium]|nr:LysM peptidoglycan-binding domain-containing protein [Defluviitaleaceae bacterium]